MSARVRVVLVGGGYTSIWAYRALRRRMRDRVEITIVSPVPHHVFHGWTGEILAGVLPPEAQRSPLSEACPAASYVQGLVTAVDATARTVAVHGPEGVRTLPYDHLVVGTGARHRTAPVPGLARHGLSLRDERALPRLTGQVDRQLDAAATASGLERERLSTVVVVGGGLTGTEAASALSGRVRERGGRVLLVSAAGSLGRDFVDHPRLARRVAEDVDRADVTVLTSRRAVEVTSDGVRLDDGTAVPAGTVVSALGYVGTPLAGLDHLPYDVSGRLVTSPTLEVAPGVWAGGDAARVPRAGGGWCPSDALWAIRQGTWIGRGIARAARGADPRPFTYTGLGRAAAFDVGRATVELYGVPLTGWTAYLARVSFFLWFIPSRRQTARVAQMWMRRMWMRRPAGTQPASTSLTGVRTAA